MGIIYSASEFFKRIKTNDDESSDKEKLLDFLKRLKSLESKLWGTTINNIAGEEEKLLEDANHILQVFTKNDISDIKKIFKFKEVNEFITETDKLREDFNYFKKMIKEEDRLKNLITKYTIKLVSHRNFKKLEKIFILEKQLYNVIERQDAEFQVLFSDFCKIKSVSKENQADKFIEALRDIRKILAGHMDYHSLWEDERYGFSNTSNILHSLIKTVDEEDFEESENEMQLSVSH